MTKINIALDLNNADKDTNRIVDAFEFNQGLQLRIFSDVLDSMHYYIHENMNLFGINGAIRLELAGKLIEKYFSYGYLRQYPNAGNDNKKEYNFNSCLGNTENTLNFQQSTVEVIDNIVKDFNFNDVSWRLYNRVFENIYTYIHGGYNFPGDNDAVCWEIAFRLAEKFYDEQKI